MNPDNFDANTITPEHIKRAMRAMHEAMIAKTRCRDVDAVLREYPGAYPSAIEELLGMHDVGNCRCQKKEQ